MHVCLDQLGQSIFILSTLVSQGTSVFTGIQTLTLSRSVPLILFRFVVLFFGLRDIALLCFWLLKFVFLYVKRPWEL